MSLRLAVASSFVDRNVVSCVKCSEGFLSLFGPTKAQPRLTRCFRRKTHVAQAMDTQSLQASRPRIHGSLVQCIRSVPTAYAFKHLHTSNTVPKGWWPSHEAAGESKDTGGESKGKSGELKDTGGETKGEDLKDGETVSVLYAF